METKMTYSNHGWKFDHDDKAHAYVDYCMDSQVGWVWGAHVDYKHWNQGIGAAANQARIDEFSKDFWNYTIAYLACTVDSSNVAQIKIMNKNGWKELDRFYNPCTEHEVILFGRSLFKKD